MAVKNPADEPHLSPLVRLKEGVHRRDYPLRDLNYRAGGRINLRNELIEIDGNLAEREAGEHRLTLRLTNRSDSSLRLARLFLPLSEGLEEFMQGRKRENIAFLSNGYQSWSASRSYRLNERPFRSWLRIVSTISGNTANLPSNKMGDFSGEMFALIADTAADEAILIGQGFPFDQFLYIRTVVSDWTAPTSHFEIIYDFGRQTLAPDQEIVLDEILIRRGKIDLLQQEYLATLTSDFSLSPPAALNGWSSWYFYFNRLGPDTLRKNLAFLVESKLPLSVFQIDDGYQRRVGDWFDPAPGFERMDRIATEITEAGFTPGIWLSPFIADRKSRLVREHPEYLLRSEYGKAIPAGYNLNWPGKVYYALDITNPRVEEYVRRVVRTLTREWGFGYLKLDFLYAACLRGGAHKNMRLSRAQIMKYALGLIRDETGEKIYLNGCGMPLSAGIGFFDAMRVGADTAPVWHRKIGRVLRSASVEGVKNSIRNSFVRAPMNRRLWRNDPDCVMLRRVGSKLTNDERRSQINAGILAGGLLFFSDDFSRLAPEEIEEAGQILTFHRKCAAGTTSVPDLMEREFPELVINSAGFVGVFNMGNRAVQREYDIDRLGSAARGSHRLKEVWSGETFVLRSGRLRLPVISPHGSLLLQMAD